jgi:hypothetical protein
LKHIPGILGASVEFQHHVFHHSEVSVVQFFESLWGATPKFIQVVTVYCYFLHKGILRFELMAKVKKPRPTFLPGASL